MVRTRLAACVQIHAVEGVYRWKGEVFNGPEWVLAIKTTEGRYAELEKFIRANHSYETPEIVRLAIAGGSREYLAWVSECVGGAEA
jgi:periplasmic divalent cation tolerance protein